MECCTYRINKQLEGKPHSSYPEDFPICALYNKTFVMWGNEKDGYYIQSTIGDSDRLYKLTKQGALYLNSKDSKGVFTS